MKKVVTMVGPVLAALFLGERVDRTSWIAVAGGFMGVLIVMRPSFSVFDRYTVLVLASGIFLGAHLALTRVLTRAAGPLIMSTYSALVIVLATSTVLVFRWQSLAGWQVGQFMLMGAVSAASQWFMLLAFARSPASFLAPFTYAEIPAAVVIGLVMFADLPDAVAWAGIALIIISGLIVARRALLAATLERKRSPGV